MAHPLSAANTGTILRAVSAGGLPDRWGTALQFSAMILARVPFSTLERLMIANRLPDTADMAPPVFILGHWRSGTTHLYNIMSHDPGFAYVSPAAVGLPWDMFGLARAFRAAIHRALPEDRWIDRMPVTPTSPQEDEVAIASMTDLSFYHGIYFPRRFDALIDRGLFFDGCSEAEITRWQRRFTYFLRKLSLAEGGRPLLIKNPVYTGRVTMLRELFPQAKFIHIHRNPVDVFLSMRNFYQRLIEKLALQNAPPELDIEETVLRIYDRMMERFIIETADLGPNELVEIPYAELDQEPLDAIARIYAGLGLPGFDAARPRFDAYLASIEGFEKNAFSADAAMIERVTERWTRWIKHFGYDAPLAAS